MPPRFTASLLWLALVSPAVALQAEQPPERRHGKLDLPDPAPLQEEPVPAPAPVPEIPPSGLWGTPANRAEEVFAQFELLPQVRASDLRTALEQLHALGLGTHDTALKALGSPHAPSVELAARLLVSVGKAEDAESLVGAASTAGNLEASNACLESAARLNGGWLPEIAARLLDHPQRGVRAAVETRLAKLAHASHRPALLDLLRNGRDGDVRLRAARLLRNFPGDGDARAALRASLSDPSLSVAFEAADALAGTSRPEEVTYVRQEMRSAEPGLPLGYLCYALLRQQELVSVLLVSDELLPKLRLALGNPDPFVAGTAASALAEYHFRSETEEGIGPVEAEVLHLLVKSVAGTLYPQYARFAPLAEDSLQRLTGEDFSGRDPNAWLAWHAANHKDFRAVRGVLPLVAADYPRLRVSWQSGAAPARALGGPAADGALRWLGARDLEALVAALDAAQLLDVDVLPGSYGPSEEAVQCRIEIVAGERRKRLSFRGAAGASWLPPLLAELERLHQEQTWQLLAAGELEPAFVMERLPVWDAADADLRRRLLVDWSLGRAATMPDAALAEWCALLARTAGLEPVWNPVLGTELVAEIPARAGNAELALHLLQAALRVPAPDVVEPFLDSVHGLGEPLRSDLLLEGLSRFGPAVASERLRQDERLAVRVAAARALGRTGGAGREALLAALQDANPLVVRMAVRSLGELRDGGTLAQLLALAAPGQPKEVRKEALWALGQLQAAAGVELLVTAARDEDNGIRLAAIDALSRVPGPEVLAAFAALYPDFAATPLEVPFQRALEGRGAGAARAVLEQHLEGVQATVARRAALAAGRLGDPVAAPFLIGLLPESPNDPELLDALAFCLCVDFRATPDPAGVYTAWWRDNARRSPSLWLAKAAADCGLPLPDEFTQGGGIQHPAPVAQALLAVLEKGPSMLRPAAAFYLFQLTGVDAPAVSGSAPRPVVQQVAQGWHAWLQARANG